MPRKLKSGHEYGKSIKFDFGIRDRLYREIFDIIARDVRGCLPEGYLYEIRAGHCSVCWYSFIDEKWQNREVTGELPVWKEGNCCRIVGTFINQAPIPNLRLEVYLTCLKDVICQT